MFSKLTQQSGKQVTRNLKKSNNKASKSLHQVSKKNSSTLKDNSDVKVMCVNRGEIATRVYRAAKQLGFSSLGVYSNVDTKSLHRFKADKCVPLDATKSPVGQYLDIDGLIKIALENGASIIHPGYGFLGENPELADKVRKAGLLFAGPQADVITFFGDKVESKKFAMKHGIPVARGSDGTIDTLEEAKRFSAEITYPVMVKACAGGGGRGIRVARDEVDLVDAIERAKSEAMAAFGNDDIFIEKYIEEPRHIEVQILGDNYGNIVHVFERDCSVQRRNQKVVEIAPAFTLPDDVRKRICDDAVKLCKAAKYSSAGTCEFLVDKNNNYFFMECNTRIQVEHTVTEEITGIDIVGAQLKIAQGASLEELGLTQDKISYKGVAVQLRLTTEDAGNDFAPDTGIIHQYKPGGGKGIRIDGNAYPGCEITPAYDSLLCKITGRANTFQEAIRNLEREILETKISGVKTNQNFLLNVLRNEQFQTGEFSTNFIPENPDLFNFPPKLDHQTAILNWFGEYAVNKQPMLQGAAFNTTANSPIPPTIPKNEQLDNLTGWKDVLRKDGPQGLADQVAKHPKVLFTDTTMRDAHQSLLMTRMRTRDLLQVADVVKQTHRELFSLENWGGATFDVALRFLHEDPWERLERLREAIPNIPFQMLLRGANAVGYTCYADNVVHKFCQQSVKSGMDVFRIFDSLNYIENMKLGIDAVGQAGGVVEATICYTGLRDKYTLDYYVEYARQLVNYGTHFLALKDMTGLLKPADATVLISALKKEFPNTPLHVHMHDNAGSAVASLYACVEAGADIIDVATDSMSGVTSQGSMGTMAHILKGHKRDPQIDTTNDYGLNVYWGSVREVYAPFESPERASFSDTYQHEMPGGQYTNLQFQAKSMGLGNEWARVKQCYIDANKLLGDIIKVTPSSKVVGDLANIMVTNKLNYQSVIDQADSLDLPQSVLEYLQGYLGQPYGGFSEPFRSTALKAAGLEPLKGRPGDVIEPFDFEAEKQKLIQQHGDQLAISDSDVISSSIYPAVFQDFCNFRKRYGDLTDVPTEYLLRSIEQGEQVQLTLKDDTPMDFELLGLGQTNKLTGLQKVTFKVNGALRTVEIQDNSVQIQAVLNEAADPSNSQHVASPIKANLVALKVQVGEEVEQNQTVAVVSAMKMEMTVKAQTGGKVKRIVQQVGSSLGSGDLIIELE